MIDLRTRSHQPELMDGAGLADPALHARCLADLSQVNRVTWAHRPLLRWLRDDWARRRAVEPLSVLDVGSGHGDLLRAIRQLALRERRSVRLTGIDLHPDSTAAARAATPRSADIAFHTADLFDWFTAPPAHGQPDYIVSSQMTHHLDDDQVVDFVRWLETHARRGWFIADLHRHWFAYLGFRWLARAAGWHRVVRLDGTLSIARSFTPHDWHALLGRAGVPQLTSRDGRPAGSMRAALASAPGPGPATATAATTAAPMAAATSAARTTAAARSTPATPASVAGAVVSRRFPFRLCVSRLKASTEAALPADRAGTTGAERGAHVVTGAAP